MNLDLDIKDIVIVNWEIVAKAVNILGGLELEISEEELENQWINGYLTEVVAESGIATTGPFVTSGLQLCDGAKVVAYCRNRQGSIGSDAGRTMRQRLVLDQLLEKIKKSDSSIRIQLVNTLSEHVITTLSAKEILSLIQNASAYTIEDTAGFPFKSYSQPYVGQILIGDPLIATSLKINAKELHTFLFGNDGYQPSLHIQQISSLIDTLAGF